MAANYRPRSHRPHRGIRSGVANNGRRDHPVGRGTVAAGGVFIPPVCGVENGSAHGARYSACSARMPTTITSRLSTSCCWTSSHGTLRPSRKVTSSGTSFRHCVLPSGWLQWASRYGCVSCWCRASPTPRRTSKACPVCRADEECRVGGSAAVPPARAPSNGRLSASTTNWRTGLHARPNCWRRRSPGFGTWDVMPVEIWRLWLNGPPDRDEYCMDNDNSLPRSPAFIGPFPGDRHRVCAGPGFDFRLLLGSRRSSVHRPVYRRNRAAKRRPPAWWARSAC